MVVLHLQCILIVSYTNKIWLEKCFINDKYCFKTKHIIMKLPIMDDLPKQRIEQSSFFTWNRFCGAILNKKSALKHIDYLYILYVFLRRHYRSMWFVILRILFNVLKRFTSLYGFVQIFFRYCDKFCCQPQIIELKNLFHTKKKHGCL